MLIFSLVLFFLLLLARHVIVVIVVVIYFFFVEVAINCIYHNRILLQVTGVNLPRRRIRTSDGHDIIINAYQGGGEKYVGMWRVGAEVLPLP